MVRNIRSTLRTAVILCAFAGALVGDTSLAFNPQEPSAAERRPSRHNDELTFTQIDFPGAAATNARGINDRGLIVGAFEVVINVPSGFLLNDGVFIQIDFPGGTGTTTNGINNRGQMVGTFFDAGGQPHGIVLDNGVFTQFDPPGAMFTVPATINDRGQIVGRFGDAAGVAHGFLFDEGAFTKIDFPGAPNTAVIGINDRGQMVGVFGEALEQAQGFLLDDGVYAQINVPGATATVPSGINNRNQIVGAFIDVEGTQHGFLLSDGVFTQIDLPGATGTGISTINERGQMVGNFADAAGAIHGFLATKEQFDGKAIGLGAGADNTAVEIVGTFTSPIDLDLSTATFNITSLLNERTGSGEIISGLPLVLTAAPGSRRNFAVFVDRSRPNLASVTIHDAGPGKFNFKIKVDDATINSPQNCSPTRLTTGFRLDAGNNAPIVVSTERSWDCSGPSSGSLKTH
jgi:uncharacterized membrane protein